MSSLPRPPVAAVNSDPGEPSPAPSLTSTALQARGGSAAALEGLIAATQDDVRRFIGSLAGPLHSEELTQETFIRALRGLPGFAGRSSVLTWLFSIARHTVVDRYRSGAARPMEQPVADWETFAADTTGGVSGTVAARGRFDEAIALFDLLRHLAPDRRQVFVATQVEGYSYAEVAEMSGLPIGTVRSRVARARAELAAAVRAAEDAA